MVACYGFDPCQVPGQSLLPTTSLLIVHTEYKWSTYHTHAAHSHGNTIYGYNRIVVTLLVFNVVFELPVSAHQYDFD